MVVIGDWVTYRFLRKKNQSCARSTIEAEGAAAENLVDVGIWLKMMYCDLIDG